MKRFVRIFIIAVSAVFVAVLSGENFFSWIPADHITESMATSSVANAAEEPLKAGMIDLKTGKKIKYWAAPMDPAYIRNEPGKSPMGMDLVPVYEEEGGEKEAASLIRIDPVTIQNMGVRIKPVVRKSLTKEIRTFGNITYDERRIYTVNIKFNGWIEKLHVSFVGERVKKGQPLFDIYSPELVTAQEEYLLALKQYDMFAEREYENMLDNAEFLLQASRIRLQYWDLTESQIKTLEKSGTVKKTLTVHSPEDGVVIKKNAFKGHFAKAGVQQYEIADLSTIWVDVDIYEYELPWIKKGMTAEMALSYVPGRQFTGKVLFIYPFLSAKTRTARIRLEFPNPDFELKPDMYANIYLKSTMAEESLAIPQEAVIDSGLRKVVFVALGEGKFQPREVELGLEGNHNEYQVLQGLREGENVVVSAQFMLDSESRLREAIQKMLDVQASPEGGNQGDAKGAKENPDADLEDMAMDGDDDLDMEGLSMDDVSEKPVKPSRE